VNDILNAAASRDDDFKVKKGDKSGELKAKQNAARKKKKSQRQNRKSGRR
jgi:hypothetical protein